MDKVDYIIDTSDSEESALHALSKMARSHFGDGEFELMIDRSASEEEAKEKIVTMARQAQKAPKTKEDQPLVDVPGLRELTTPQNWYDAVDNASIIAKPLTFMTTPITEAARAPFKYVAENVGENTSQTPPINTAAEYGSFKPSDRAGLGLLMTDLSNAMGIEQTPILDIESEDYPKAAEFARQMTNPANAGGAALDVALSGKIPQVGVVSGLASTAEDVGTYASKAKRALGGKSNPDTSGLRQAVVENKVPKISLDAATDYLRSVSKDKKLLLDLEKSGKIKDVAKRVQDDPDKYLQIMSPKKIYKEAMDDTANLMNYQDDIVDRIPMNQYSIAPEELQKIAIAELDNLGQMEADQKQSARNFVEKNIPIAQPNPEKIQRINLARQARRSINGLKRRIEDQKFAAQSEAMNNTMSSSPVSMVEQNKLSAMMDELERIQTVFDENFDPTMPLPEAYKNYIRQSNEKPAGWVSKMRQLGNKLMEPPVPGQVSTDIGAKQMAGRAIQAASRKAQDQVMGFMDQADQMAYSGQNKKISDLINLRELTEGNLSNANQAGDIYVPGGATGRTGFISEIGKGMNRYVKPGLQGVGSNILNNSNVFGQSRGLQVGGAMTAAKEFEYSKAAVNEFKIPRDTASAIQYKDMVIRKIEREFGPEMSKAFQSAQTQEEMANLISNLSKVNPMAFAPSPYNAIDGIIYDPIMKQKALEDIVKQSGSAYHRANKAEALLLDNRILP